MTAAEAKDLFAPESGGRATGTGTAAETPEAWRRKPEDCCDDDCDDCDDCCDDGGSGCDGGSKGRPQAPAPAAPATTAAASTATCAPVDAAEGGVGTRLQAAAEEGSTAHAMLLLMFRFWFCLRAESTEAVRIILTF